MISSRAVAEACTTGRGPSGRSVHTRQARAAASSFAIKLS
jgi:hypothetical protein